MDLHHHSAGQQPSDSRYTKVATATDAQLLLLLLDDQPGMLGASSLYLCQTTAPAANTTDCTCWNTDRAVAQHAANPASTTATRCVWDAVDQLPPLLPHSTSPQQDSQQDRGSTVGPRIPRYAHDTRVPTASPSHESTRRGVLRRGPNGEPGAAGKPTTAAIVVGKPGGGSRGGSGGGVATPRADTGRTSPEPQLELRHILVHLLKRVIVGCCAVL